ncbi:MAG: WS/DGAT domain-containing protein, partial [Candidatus Nanopelagicales bacterium]|nr:WS/DGAT domain-containing protein [Candidatus Nanopelagicales bacterium]
STTAAGLGKLLRGRGENTDGLIVRTVIPVSTRAEDQHYTYGNMIGAMVAELPVGERDPWKRLEMVQKCTRKAKQAKQPAGVDFVAQAGEFLPASLIAIAGRVAAMQPMYSLVVTNVPGPREPLYFVGGKLEDAYFFGPNLVERTDLAVAVLSYNGELNFGLTADRYRVPDIAVMASGIAEALAELSAR